MVTNNSFLVELREIPEIVCVTRMCGFANGPCQPENTDPPDADNTCPPPIVDHLAIVVQIVVRMIK